MYLYMQSVNIDSWLSIYYTVMSFKLTSVTVRIYNFIEKFCFNGTKSHIDLYIQVNKAQDSYWNTDLI